jgi:hypothetical protein
MPEPARLSVIPNRAVTEVKGTLRRIWLYAFDSAGAPVDPATVTFSYLVPGGSDPTTYTTPNAFITKVATGEYRVDLALSEEGVYEIRWETGSDFVGAYEEKITVAPSSF